MSRIARAVKEHGAPLPGIAAYFYDPIFVEIAAKLGFRVLWIEMEHAFITFAQAADLCRIASGNGMLTMIRISDNRRENVLKAAECGPDIIDLPMADTPQIVEEFVQHARFRPEGARGYFSVPRALDYGMVESLPQAQQKLNSELSLMIQIETAEAVQRAEELCAISGVDIFLGPADLGEHLEHGEGEDHRRHADAQRPAGFGANVKVCGRKNAAQEKACERRAERQLRHVPFEDVLQPPAVLLFA